MKNPAPPSPLTPQEAEPTMEEILNVPFSFDKDRGLPRPSSPSVAPETFSAFIPVDKQELPTIAQQILATTAMMKRGGTYENNSLCWSPAELELLAMYAITAKHKLQHLTALSDLFAGMRENGGLTQNEERALTALAHD